MVKKSDAKTPATDSSACKVKVQKYYVPEDPESDPKTPATDSSARKGKVQKEYILEDPESDPTLSYS